MPTMDGTGQLTVEAIMAEWYRFAATQAGFCESYLRLHRARHGITRKQQQALFGATDEQFDHLQGMPLPPDSAADFDGHVRKIAAHCGIPPSHIPAVMQAFRVAHLVATTASGGGAAESEGA